MSSQTHQFLSLLVIVLASSSICFGSYVLEGKLVDNNHDGHESVGSYPTLFGTEVLSKAMAPHYSASSNNIVVNVDQFGAKGDGRDDTQAFRRAWNKACSSRRDVDLVVPRHGNYQLKQINFTGPCKSRVTLKIYGTIKASPQRSDYIKDLRHWILFEDMTNFTVEGGGTFNGNGRIWWQNSCKVNESLPCTIAPNAVTFYGCNNLEVQYLKFLNSQKMHLSFHNCMNVRASNLIVTAPEDSPNTDGIHVTGTQDIDIKNCIIGTGDDCISIVSGSKNVRASGITCGPGHGISIGSLGAGNSKANVSDVMISGARIVGATNGLRIKTWQGGSGFAKNIKFENIMMLNVSNPIIINQNYCDQETPCQEQASAVKISNVVYENIKGTSASEVAVNFDCSKHSTCQGILLQDVNLKHQGDGIAQASCENVKLSDRGTVSPKCSSLS